MYNDYYYGFARDLLMWLKMAAKLDGYGFFFVEYEYFGTCKMKKTQKFGYDGVVPHDGPFNT